MLGLEGEACFWELATLIDIMLVGHWIEIEMRSVMGAPRALEELAASMPSEAHRLTESGETEDVPVDQLVDSGLILVKPGEKVPADGRIADGHSALDEAMSAGESKPVGKSDGDDVIGGSITGEGALEVELEKTGDDSYLSQVIELVRRARESNSQTQDLANRAAVWLTGIAPTAGAVTLTTWLMFSGQTVEFAIERMVTVMVITCPHALGLAVPLVVAVSTSLGAQNGLLVRNRPAFEAARNIDALLFGNTGTLTRGEFGVTDTFVFEKAADELTEDELLKLAGSLESHSEHPVDQGIGRAVDDPHPVEDFESMTGKGVEGIVQGEEIKAVSPNYLRENGYSYDDDRVDEALATGKTVVYVIRDGALEGAITPRDHAHLLKSPLRSGCVARSPPGPPFPNPTGKPRCHICSLESSCLFRLTRLCRLPAHH